MQILVADAKFPFDRLRLLLVLSLRAVRRLSYLLLLLRLCLGCAVLLLAFFRVIRLRPRHLSQNKIL